MDKKNNQRKSKAELFNEFLESAPESKLAFSDSFEGAHKQRSGFTGGSDGKYGIKTKEKWEHAKDPSNTGIIWNRTIIGPGGKKVTQS